MELQNILEDAGLVLGAATFLWASKELAVNYFLPWTKEIEKKYDIEDALKDYKFSDDE